MTVVRAGDFRYIEIFVNTILAQFARSGCILRFKDLGWLWTERSTKLIPVVHQDVWCPDGGGREPKIFNVSILWLIPPEIVVYPLLKVIGRVMIHSSDFLDLSVSIWRQYRALWSVYYGQCNCYCIFSKCCNNFSNFLPFSAAFCCPM